MYAVLFVAIVGAGGFGGFGLFYTGLDVKGINQVLSNHGIEGISAYQTGLGGGGYGGGDRLIFGGYGFGTQENLQGDSMTVGVEGGAGFFNVGYELLPNGPIDLFGILGIGGGGYTFEFKPEQGSVSFDSLIADPHRFAAVKYSSFSVELGVMGIVEVKKGAPMIGLAVKASYILPVTEKWENMDGTDLLGTPDFSFRGANLSLFLMFGGWM